MSVVIASDDISFASREQFLPTSPWLGDAHYILKENTHIVGERTFEILGLFSCELNGCKKKIKIESLILSSVALRKNMLPSAFFEEMNLI